MSEFDASNTVMVLTLVLCDLSFWFLFSVFCSISCFILLSLSHVCSSAVHFLLLFFFVPAHWSSAPPWLVSPGVIYTALPWVLTTICFQICLVNSLCVTFAIWFPCSLYFCLWCFGASLDLEFWIFAHFGSVCLLLDFLWFWPLLGNNLWVYLSLNKSVKFTCFTSCVCI